MADVVKSEVAATSDPTWALTEKVLKVDGFAQDAGVREKKVGSHPDVFLLVEATKSFQAGLPKIIPSLRAPIEECRNASGYRGASNTYRYVETGLEGADLRILIVGAYTDFSIRRVVGMEMEPCVAIWRMWPEILRCGEKYRLNWRVAFVPVWDLRERERRAVA